MRLQTQVEPEIQKRLLLSRVEAESLKERDILCPTCGFRIQRVFSDATGHLSVKCQKCKNVHIFKSRLLPQNPQERIWQELQAMKITSKYRNDF